MGKIFFIGDSITAGAWDAGGGWANRLISRIMLETIRGIADQREFYCLPYNLGVSGDTAADIVPRLKNEIMPRLDNSNPDEAIQIVYAIGTNDSVFMVDTQQPRFTDREFHTNLEDIVKISLDITDNISFIGLLPVEENKVNPIPWAPDMAYLNKRVERFENIAADVCKSHNLLFMPFFERWSTLPGYADLFLDGVHPNSTGHEKMAQEIEGYLMTPDFFRFHSA